MKEKRCKLQTERLVVDMEELVRIGNKDAERRNGWKKRKEIGEKHGRRSGASGPSREYGLFDGVDFY